MCLWSLLSAGGHRRVNPSRDRLNRQDLGINKDIVSQ